MDPNIPTQPTQNEIPITQPVLSQPTMNTYTKRGLKKGLIVGFISLIPPLLYFLCIKNCFELGCLPCLFLSLPMSLWGNKLISFLFPTIAFQMENNYPIVTIAYSIFDFVFAFGITFFLIVISGRIKNKKLFYRTDLIILLLLIIAIVTLFVYKSTNKIDQWTDLGKLENGTQISSIVSWRGELCISSSTSVQCYNGLSWHTIQKDILSPSPLVVWDNQLCYAKGYYASDKRGVYCYDGSSLKNIGSNEETYFFLEVWNGQLCQKGENTAKCYDGISWKPKIDKSGDFWTVWGGKLCFGINGLIECYDGQNWVDMGNEIGDGKWYTIPFVWDQKLCAASSKETNSYGPYGANAFNIKCFDGLRWEDTHWNGKLDQFGKSILSVWEDQLCVAEAYGLVSCYNGKNWKTQGATNATISSMGVWNGELCVGTNGLVRCLK